MDSNPKSPRLSPLNLWRTNIDALRSRTFRRLSRGVAAQGYNQGVTIALQLLSIPLLLHAWGAERYGTWLALTALPAYLGLADLGFIQITANDMTIKVARADRSGALAVFQSTLLFVCAVSAVMLCAAALLIYLVPFDRFLKTTETATGVASVLGIMSLHVSLAFFSGLFAAGFRAEGQYARSVMLFSSGRLAEGMSTLAVAALGGGLVAAATTMLLIRIITLIVARVSLSKVASWLTLKFAAADLGTIRRMIAPSGAFAAYTLGNMITIQGVVVALAAAMGPATVAMFSAARTLARLGPTAANAVSFPLQPEYSAAFGSQASSKFRRLFVQQTRVTLGLSLLYLVVLLSCGDYIIRLWTRDLIAVPYELLCLLIVGCALEIVWTSLQTPLVATNHHQWMGSAYLFTSLAGFMLLGTLLEKFGVIAVGWYTVTLGLLMVLIGSQQLRRFFLSNNLVSIRGESP